MKRLQIVFLLLTLSITACETIHGIQNHESNFPKLENPSCIEEAVKNTSGVEFIKSENEFDNSAQAFWTQKKVEHRDYIVRYKINNLNRKDYDAFVVISEATSEDSSQSHNYRNYSNHFGRLNGQSYSNEDLAIARNVMSSVNDSVRKVCNLKNFNPTFTE